jgi:hypothetical protein
METYTNFMLNQVGSANTYAKPSGPEIEEMLRAQKLRKFGVFTRFAHLMELKSTPQVRTFIIPKMRF